MSFPRVAAARGIPDDDGPLHEAGTRSTGASGFLPEPALSGVEGVEMTNLDMVHEYRSLSRATNRHSEPWARNPVASVLRR